VVNWAWLLNSVWWKSLRLKRSTKICLLKASLNSNIKFRIVVKGIFVRFLVQCSCSSYTSSIEDVLTLCVRMFVHFRQRILLRNVSLRSCTWAHQVRTTFSLFTEIETKQPDTICVNFSAKSHSRRSLIWRSELYHNRSVNLREVTSIRKLIKRSFCFQTLKYKAYPKDWRGFKSE
jgi:hypothetical protein